MVTDEENKFCSASKPSDSYSSIKSALRTFKRAWISARSIIFLDDLQATKQKGFGKFNLAGCYPRKYRGKVEPSGCYLLTNLRSLDVAIKAFKHRTGIEAMFKDCKSGGYNLEASHAQGQRLMALILLIAIAYSCAILAGRNWRQVGLQKYLVRLQELKRIHRRHSAFWVSLYGHLWVGAMEF